MQNTHYKGMSGSTFVSGDRDAFDVAALFCQKTYTLLMWLHFCVRRQTYCWCGSTCVSGYRNTIDVAPLLCQETVMLLMWLHFRIRRTDILLMWLHSCVSRQKCYWCGSTFVSGDRRTVDVAPLSH